MTDHREVLYTIDTKGKRKWVYAAWVKGKYGVQRAFAAYFLILFYLSLPWITINGKQAVLLQIAERKFTFFGTTFWATDTLLLALVLAFLGICLFFFTAVIGRVWCGWACPETVFLEFVFRPIERLIEGGPAQRLRLDQSPWTKEKILKKGLKHLFCAAMAWILASTALAYFYGRDPLFEMMVSPPWENWQPFLMTLALMGVMAFQFGWFREQFCTILCPYARFQSVLMDHHSLGVGYDPVRGEPRGKASKKDVGDCVDCGLCVRVCPTGIDIRNGSQLECIHCAACIDACDSVMEKLGRPKGLIRYDTEARLLSGEKNLKSVSVRTAIYGSILLAISIAIGYTLMTRNPSEVKITRGASDVPFTELPDGRISNHVHVRISNRGEESRLYSIKSDRDDLQLIFPAMPYPVPEDSLLTVPLFIQFSRGILDGGRAPIVLTVSDDAGYHEDIKMVLLGPG
ncbi:MAG: cytochrome c oxidase accessory protein CcoG [Bdellovibrionales bacterium]|nr:cytochrome c oxidase accessory protein CcoG [Bdellovibrionales bacterium]